MLEGEMSKKHQLTAGEIKGIQLIADLFVIEDLKKNVFSREMPSHIKDLDAHLRLQVPRIYLAQNELQKAIAKTEKVWLNELSKEN